MGVLIAVTPARVLPGPALALATLLATAPAAAPAPDPSPDALTRVPAGGAQADVRARYGHAFREIDTDHFRVVSDTSPWAHRVIAAQLEQFYRAVHPRFFTNEMPPLTVLLIHGGTDFEHYMKSHGHDDEAQAYGMYDARTHTVFARRCFPDGKSSGLGTVFHETGHAMLQADFGRRDVPSWFGEGFASLFERGRVVRGHWIYGNPNPMRETVLRKAYDGGQIPTLASYFRLSDEEFMAARGLGYSVGRSFFLYLLRSHGEEALRRFVAAVRTGQSPVKALGTGWTMGKLEQGWRRSIVDINFAGDYLYRAEGPRTLQTLEEGVARYPGYGNLQVALAQELARRKRLAESAAHARAALRDPRCTDVALAWSLLGYALWTRDAGAARMAFRTAVRCQPWNEEIMDYEYDHLATLCEAGGDRATANRLRAELAAMKTQSSPSGCAP